MKRWVFAGICRRPHTLASDLPPPGVPPAAPRAPAAYVPAITPVYNWGGVYFGFNLGFGFGTSNWTDPNGILTSAASGCSARPRVFGFRPPVRDWVMPSIACCSTAPPVARLATLQRGKRTTKGGWTAGAGVEVALGENITARIEYLYLKLQNTVCTNASACGSDPGGPPNDTVKFSTNMIRLGLDYKFH
jgi:opacity protein-like surface antigen